MFPKFQWQRPRGKQTRLLKSNINSYSSNNCDNNKSYSNSNHQRHNNNSNQSLTTTATEQQQQQQQPDKKGKATKAKNKMAWTEQHGACEREEGNP